MKCWVCERLVNKLIPTHLDSICVCNYLNNVYFNFGINGGAYRECADMDIFRTAKLIIYIYDLLT